MEYRRLGKAGVQVSALSLGSWVTFGQQISDDVAAELMKTAYDNGVNFFDNAEAYAAGRSETVMGHILHKMAWSHETFLVSSKVFWGGSLPNQEGLSRKHVMEACHNALRRLQVEYLDLYFCHRPDPKTPIEETVRAMSDLVHQGKVLYWGTSEWSAQEITQAHAIAGECHLVPPTMEQPMYHLFGRHRVEKEFERLYAEYGMGTTIWSPLASGLLTGKHKGGPAEGTRATLKDYDWLKESIARDAKEKGAKVDKLGAIAKELGLSLAVFSIAWCLKNPNVSTVILGASKVAQLTENLQAVDAQAKLTPEVMKRVDEIAGV
jgi:voltage-dependent potassium channel beta subunit